MYNFEVPEHAENIKLEGTTIYRCNKIILTNSRKVTYEKVNKGNIDLVLDEWNHFTKNGGDGNRISSNDMVIYIDKKLNNIYKI